MNNKLLLLFVFALNVLPAQNSYIRSTLPIRDGIIYNPDNGRPFSELVTELFDNGFANHSHTRLNPSNFRMVILKIVSVATIQ